MNQLTMQHYIRGIAGALIGAVVGYFAFSFVVGHGLYAMILPGACVGLACGYLSRVESKTLGIIAAIVGLAVSVLSEAHQFPFIKDKSLTYFITHIHEVLPMHLVMMALGTAFAFWFGRGRERFAGSSNVDVG